MSVAPFDTDKLDRLLAEAGTDAVIATSKHNVQYLLGGYRYFFFANMDAIGLSRYLPAVGYLRDRTEDSFYIGCGNEDWGTQIWPPWVDDVQNTTWSSLDTARSVAVALRKRGLEEATIAVELSFVPADFLDALRRELPRSTFTNAQTLLESLRSVKSSAELEIVTAASEGIIGSMLSTFDEVHPGMTKLEIVERFRRHQTERGLVFDYCLVSVGPSLNRAPSAEVWQRNSILSLDSGGMFGGYIGDLARMAVSNGPTEHMVELMDDIEAVQQVARTAVRAGVRGADIFDAATSQVAESKHRGQLKFVAHGMGLITHEAPRLTSTGPVPYPADHAERSLESGNVISVETWTEDAVVGFVKVEDTLIVTDNGWVAPGDLGRGYNIVRD